MRQSKVPQLSLIALLVLCFGLAAWLDTKAQSQEREGASSNIMGALFGDTRQLFAGYFYRKADVYFHSGFYPTIFDNREAFQTEHMAEDSGAVEGHNKGDEETFLGPPHDWIDAFSRHFFPSRHTHLDEGGASGDLGDSSQVREILPWLDLSAALDPHNIQTYTVTAYWLRQRMHRPDEAEKFLRQGLRENPGSYEILYELGRCYAKNHHDYFRARNLWEAALRSWQEHEGNKDPKDQDKFLYIQIVSRLAGLERDQSHYAQARKYLVMWRDMTPNRQDVQKLLDEFDQQHPDAAGSGTNSPPTMSHEPKP